MTDQNEGLGDVIEKYLRRFYAGMVDVTDQKNVYDSIMQEVERRLISVTLETAKGNRLKTAKILGLNRNTLLKKMSQFDLDDKVNQKNATMSHLYKRRKRK